MSELKLPLPYRFGAHVKGTEELENDLAGARLRVKVLTDRLSEETKRKDDLIARQRDWIVTLETKLRSALEEVAELRGEGDDDSTI